MNNKKSVFFQVIIILFIFVVIFLASVLNSFAFRSNTVQAGAENTAAVLEMVMERSEYGLKYGRELVNYYDIDKVIEDIKLYCNTDFVFITDEEGNWLYGELPPEDIAERIDEISTFDESTLTYESGDDQCILHAIMGRTDVEGYVGISYPKKLMLDKSAQYVNSILYRTLIFALIGALIFEAVFHIFDHGYDKRKLRLMILGIVVILSIASIISTYYILERAYRSLSADVSQNLLEQNSNNLAELIAQGVAYSDIKDAEGYYDKIAKRSEQVESFILDKEPAANATTHVALPKDIYGEEYYLSSVISEKYIHDRVGSAVLNVIVTMITALMLAGEVLGFLIDIVRDDNKDRRTLTENKERRTIESIGVVRGISFFFAGFRFMAVAFMSIVLAQIYRPVMIFGLMIPKEILMSLPMSSQIFISMITSYLSGIVIDKKGWKLTTAGGIAVMVAGCIASSLSVTPVPFILAQMLIGVGLGFAKMGIDLYAVSVSSEEDMAEYTAGSNAAVIVGYSCSASIGALIASIFGYSGAYIAMGCIGLVVLLILMRYGMNVIYHEDAKEKTKENKDIIESRKTGVLFPAYILCVIIPYYFIMMFVDYFFPVYANSVGITTDVIGFIIMLYGITTAYVGTALCPKLSKRYGASTLMAVILLILSAAMLCFAVKNVIYTAIITAFLIGIADGIMPSIQFEYVFELPFARRIGVSRALGIEGFFSSMIGAIAPMIFGIVMLYGSSGLIVVGVICVLMAVIFLMVNKVSVTGKRV